MNETLKFSSVTEQTSRERAAAVAMAANEIGARVVVLANEGETFYTQPKSSRAQRLEVEVGGGNVAIQTSGMFPDADMGRLHARADEIHQQMQHQQPPA